MDDDTGYRVNPLRSSDYRQGYGSSLGKRDTFRSPPFSRPVSKESVDDYDEDDEEDEIELHEEEDDDDDEINGGQVAVKDMDEDGDDDEEDDDDDEDGDENEDEVKGDGKQRIYCNLNEDADRERPRKKRKLKSLVSNYEFAPRVPAPPISTPAPAPATLVVRPTSGGRNSLTDWTERETFVLLDSWGERFLRRGKKSLRSEEWAEVAQKVSEVSSIDRTDTQCRNRLDTLKKKYKKDKAKFGDAGGAASKWIYFKKMDILLSSPPQQSGLSCGLDSGEYVFMNPKVCLKNANGLDELRDSPGDSESTDTEGDDSDGLPPKKRRCSRKTGNGSSFRLLADSIKKFGKIYENIENTRRQQMVELEKMRMDFRRELEVQRRHIMERAQAEIARLQGDNDQNDISAEDASG